MMISRRSRHSSIGGNFLRVLFPPLILFLVVLCPAGVLGEVSIPDPGTFVVDTAGIIDASVERQLEGWLRELEQKTTDRRMS